MNNNKPMDCSPQKVLFKSGNSAEEKILSKLLLNNIKKNTTVSSKYYEFSSLNNEVVKQPSKGVLTFDIWAGSEGKEVFGHRPYYWKSVLMADEEKTMFDEVLYSIELYKVRDTNKDTNTPYYCTWKGNAQNSQTWPIESIYLFVDAGHDDDYLKNIIRDILRCFTTPFAKKLYSSNFNSGKAMEVVDVNTGNYWKILQSCIDDKIDLKRMSFLNQSFIAPQIDSIMRRLFGSPVTINSSKSIQAFAYGPK